MGKTVYLTEEQLTLGIEAFYNMYIELCDRDYGEDTDVETEKSKESCRRAIIKLGGRL